MSQFFPNEKAGKIVVDLAAMMREQKDYLSEIDGAIGDGDHGINMSKGFSMVEEPISGDESLSQALKTLGKTLVEEIGGSMGPLYGSFFRAMARASRNAETIDAAAFAEMLDTAYSKIRELGDAKVGDKTLVDTLDPAITAFKRAQVEGYEFSEALDHMIAAAEKGKDSTKDLVAKVGRSSRLGERSKGVLDAGAVSCWLILRTMARSIKPLLQV